MHVWNMLHVARWKYRTQKLRKKSPSAHHHTTLSGYILATKAFIDNRKKTVKQQYLLHNSLQCGELRPTNGWDRLASLGHSSKFQWVSRLGFVTAPTSLNGGQPNFARCLAIFCADTLYIHFGGSFLLTKFCQVQHNIHFASKSFVLLFWQRYCTAIEQWASAKLCGMVQGMDLWNFRSSSFSTEDATYIPRAAITLGIGPHSSFSWF